MNRRGFLKFLGAGVAGIALEEAIPFNRVWFFPKKIVIPEPYRAYIVGTDAFINCPLNAGPLMTIYYDRRSLDLLKANAPLTKFGIEYKLPQFQGRPMLFHAYKVVKDGY